MIATAPRPKALILEQLAGYPLAAKPLCTACSNRFWCYDHKKDWEALGEPPGLQDVLRYMN